ncbi:MAG: LacI family DNA-binding transcriptional regulator [Allobranchiibius sp.]
MPDRATIADVANAARVSIKTVSRVLNDVNTVDPAMRQRVERAIAALNYVPSPTARTLRTGNASLIGVVVDAIDDPFFATLVSSVEDHAREAGLDVLVASTRFDAARERQQLLRLLGQRPRGIILAPVGQDLGFLASDRAGTPVVTVDRPVDGFDSIVGDDYAAAHRSVDLLLASGHSRIGLIGFDARFQTARLRRLAYEDALKAADLTVDPQLIPDVDFAADATRDALENVLALPEPPTALFLANARDAASVVSAIHEMGRTDLGMVSFGDFPLASALQPSVTCINQDAHQMGAMAFERLLERIERPESEPQNYVLETGFIKRSSHFLAPESKSDSAAPDGSLRG